MYVVGGMVCVWLLREPHRCKQGAVGHHLSPAGLPCSSATGASKAVLWLHISVGAGMCHGTEAGGVYLGARLALRVLRSRRRLFTCHACEVVIVKW